MRARIRRLAEAGPDAGLTLTELVVVMLITSLVLTLIGGFFVNVVNAVDVGRSAREGTGSAANALDEIARVVRSGANNPTATGPTPAVAVGSTGSTMTVISYADTAPANPTPTLVTFSVDAAGNLIEQRVASADASGYRVFTGATTKRVFTGPFTAAADMFVYRNGANEAVDPSTAAKAASVTHVEITVTVPHRGRGGDDPVRLTTVALMPNLSLL